MIKIKMGLIGLMMMSFVVFLIEVDLFCLFRCLLLVWFEFCYRISVIC